MKYPRFWKYENLGTGEIKKRVVKKMAEKRRAEEAAKKEELEKKAENGQRGYEKGTEEQKASACISSLNDNRYENDNVWCAVKPTAEDVVSVRDIPRKKTPSERCVRRNY